MTPRRAITVALWGAFATSAVAGPLPSLDSPIFDQARSILKEHAGQGTPEWARPEVTPQQRAWANKIMEKTQMRLRNSDLLEIADKALPAKLKLPEQIISEKVASEYDATHGPKNAEGAGFSIRVFTTLGEGEAGRERFVAQLHTLMAYPNAEVLIQGLPDGIEHINGLMRLLGGIARTIKEDTGSAPPPIKLAPLVFTKAGIENAPTVVYYRDGAPVARISGSLEIDYLKDRVAEGEHGKLGVRGSLYKIAETNLMIVIRRRMAKIDWQDMKEQAVKDYWRAYAAPSLPEAKEAKTFRIDPSIIVARTVRAPGGEIIAHKGEHINPLAAVPFTGAIVAFDADDKAQVEFADQMAVKVRNQGLRPILLTQGLPGRTASFEVLADLQKTLGERVYLLDSRVISRFNLQALPSVVRSDGLVFVVRQYVPDVALTRLAQGQE